MASHKPLVVIGGQIQQIPVGDTLSVAASEVDVVSATNANAAPLTIGTPVYVSSSGAVDKASASASTTARVLGLVKSTSIAPSSSGYIQTDGILSATVSEWDAVTGATGGLTAGALYYLSTTAGQITSTPPSGAGQYIIPIGMALSTTELDITIDRNGILLS